MKLRDRATEPMDKDQKGNRYWLLGEFLFLGMRPVKGADGGIGEASGWHAIFTQAGMLLEKAWISGGGI